jgi:hypothetical protein
MQPKKWLLLPKIQLLYNCQITPRFMVYNEPEQIITENH